MFLGAAASDAHQADIASSAALHSLKPEAVKA